VRLVYSVSFKKSERKLMIFALSHESFSEYIKTLIKADKERRNNIFTDEERAEIERIIEMKIGEIYYKTKDRINEEVEAKIEYNKDIGSKSILDIK
jgi:Arc/MetJ-type ribon-helix-helix transcriptional regulator